MGWKALECWDGDRARVGAVKTGIGSEGIHRPTFDFQTEYVKPSNQLKIIEHSGEIGGQYLGYFTDIHTSLVQII